MFPHPGRATDRRDQVIMRNFAPCQDPQYSGDNWVERFQDDSQQFSLSKIEANEVLGVHAVIPGNNGCTSSLSAARMSA
jgi:hypothetical protein